MKNLLLIHAHQLYQGVAAGKLNQTIATMIQTELEGRGFVVQHTHIEQGYDIDEEVQKHLWADLIILQSPVYWFGTPWIHKKYIDEVFTRGLVQQNLLKDDGRTRQDPTRQYGSGGLMQGKKYMLSLTWNAPAEAFDNPDQNLLVGKTVDDVFINNTAVYKFCGAQILPSFSYYNVIKGLDFEGDAARLRQHLARIA